MVTKRCSLVADHGEGHSQRGYAKHQLAQRDEIEIDVLMERAAFYQHHFQNDPERSVIEVAKQLDTAYQQPMGQSLLEIRQLLAQRCFLFDILTPVTKLKAGDLQLENIEAMSGALRVSNQ